MRFWVFAFLTIAVGAGAPAGAADGAAEAPARLAAQRGFKAVLEARDHMAGRSFTATVVYRYPDRALATIPPDDFVHLDGPRVTVRESKVLRTADVGAWIRAAGEALAPSFAALDALDGGGRTPDFAGAAGRLGTVLGLDLRRRGERVAIALVISQQYDLDSAAAPGFAFAAGGAVETTFSSETGFPDLVALRGPTGRVEGEVRAVSFEPLATVPDALLALPAGTDLSTAEAAEPTPRLKERLARDALGAILGRLRAAGARDEALPDREEKRIRKLLAGAYEALFRAGYAEDRLREEARRAVARDGEAARAVLAEAGEARRAETLEALGERFRDSCRRQLREALGELVRIAEAVLAPSNGGGPEGKAGEAVRRRLVAISGGAALDAFERAVVDPMAAEAGSELARIAASLDGPAAAARGGTQKGESRP